MRTQAIVGAVICLAAVVGCSSTKLANGGTVYSADTSKEIPQFDTTNLLPTNIPYKGALIPNTIVQVTPSLGIPLEKMVFWGAYAGAAYLILDPFAPNWEIAEARFPDDYISLSLHMKRFYAGGAGEARMVFHRRAKELGKSRGYDGYQVIEYSEGMESSVLGSQRTAEGVIKLTKKLG